MAAADTNIDALLAMDRFVRLMGVASSTAEVIAVVRAFLESRSKERVIRIQMTDAGWLPFDEYQQPFPIFSADDVWQIRGSVRIRCRELEASGMKIAPELLEIDLFFFFATESLAVHEGRCASRAPAEALQSGTLSTTSVNAQARRPANVARPGWQPWNDQLDRHPVARSTTNIFDL
jgi:hypothetical protein